MVLVASIRRLYGLIWDLGGLRPRGGQFCEQQHASLEAGLSKQIWSIINIEIETRRLNALHPEHPNSVLLYQTTLTCVRHDGGDPTTLTVRFGWVVEY
jgi:hypothetical protein